jgi:hypothetical protein
LPGRVSMRGLSVSRWGFPATGCRLSVLVFSIRLRGRTSIVSIHSPQTLSCKAAPSRAPLWDRRVCTR